MGDVTWRDKHPCAGCGTGYGHCARYVTQAGMQCCADCDHPGRWVADPWTADDLREAWSGREVPEHVAATIERLDPGCAESAQKTCPPPGQTAQSLRSV